MKKKLLSLLFMAFFVSFITKVKAQCDNDVSMCSITIIAGDASSDGWDGSNLQIFQDSILRGTVTVQNGDFDTDTVSIQVCPDSIVLVWNAVGQWNEDCFFEIFDIEEGTTYEYDVVDGEVSKWCVHDFGNVKVTYFEIYEYEERNSKNNTATKTIKNFNFWFDFKK